MGQELTFSPFFYPVNILAGKSAVAKRSTMPASYETTPALMVNFDGVHLQP